MKPLLANLYCFTIFHGDKPGRAHHVDLQQPVIDHRLVIIGKGVVGPDQLGLIKSFWQNLAYRQGVGDLLNDNAGEQALNRQQGAVAHL